MVLSNSHHHLSPLRYIYLNEAYVYHCAYHIIINFIDASSSLSLRRLVAMPIAHAHVHKRETIRYTVVEILEAS